MPPPPRIVAAPARRPRLKANGITRLAVFIGLTAAFSVFVTAAGLLYWRYLTIQPPTCSVSVSGNASLDGTTVTVSSLSMDTPLRDTLRPASRFSSHFFMNPGNYRIKIVDKDGTALFDESVDLYPSFPFGIDLNRLRPETQPS